MHQTEGAAGLRFVCQICDRFIDDAELGLLVWNPDKGKVLSVHKQCNANIGDPYKFTSELGTALIYLLQNSGIRDYKSLKKWYGIAQSLSRLG